MYIQSIQNATVLKLFVQRELFPFKYKSYIFLYSLNINKYTISQSIIITYIVFLSSSCYYWLCPQSIHVFFEECYKQTMCGHYLSFHFNVTFNTDFDTYSHISGFNLLSYYFAPKENRSKTTKDFGQSLVLYFYQTFAH